MFNYFHAFSRNIGWLTLAEQSQLRDKRVAIAGLGGVGGVHLLTLARLGIGRFHVADLDVFELANFNRQAGATVSALQRPKAEVMGELARDINPELELRVFSNGVTPDNVEEFLRGVDLYVDGLDFFAFKAREMVFAACARLGIPATTVAPLGMGAALLNFLPGGMTFEEYFRWRGQDDREKALRFLVGLSPAMLQRRYVVDPCTVDLARGRGPSTIMACQLCAGIAATEALKILLRRGPVRAAPHGVHFDGYRNRLAHTWRPGGNANPMQRLLLTLARRQVGGMPRNCPPPETPPDDPIGRILFAARWTPSGDNTQPWRFERIDGTHLAVHGFDTRDHVVYDVDGRPSQLAVGALLESIAIAATGEGLAAEFRRRPESPEREPVIDVTLTPAPDTPPHPLLPFLSERAVERRPLGLRRLREEEKRTLEQAAGPGFRLVWMEDFPARWEAAKLMFANARLRLTMPEAYQVHKTVIEPGARFSRDRIPDQAVGLDPMTTRLMHWAMQSWSRVDFLNRYLAGTWLPRIELDLLPGVACAAHFALVAETPPRDIDDWLAAGRAVQRFWLTAARLGLQVQPEMTPLIFSTYVRLGRRFSARPGLWELAQRLALRLDALLRGATPGAVFLGRLGAGRRAGSRSLRLSLDELTWR